MKDIILIISSVLLFIIAVVIAFASYPIYGFEMLFAVFIPIVICGLLISFMVFTLSKNNSKIAFVESLKYSFGISSLILILGYFIFCLQPIIF